MLEQLPAADSEPRQDREREHDDPDPAEPLGELPPEQEAVRQLLDMRDDAAAGGAEAGHALEEGVDGPVELRVAGEDVGERAERGCSEPGQRDDEEALADAEPVVAASRVGDRDCDAAGDRAGGEEGPDLLAVADRHGRRDEDGEAQVREQRPDDVQGADDVDGEEGRAACSASAPGRAHSAFSTSGTRRDSVKTIARSPARRTSSPRGKTARAVADDRADQRAADRHVLEAQARRTRCRAAS